MSPVRTAVPFKAVNTQPIAINVELGEEVADFSGVVRVVVQHQRRAGPKKKIKEKKTVSFVVVRGRFVEVDIVAEVASALAVAA
jgi:hypothetical protein